MPLWVWLAIGVLLGTGGTLLTSVLWLPEPEQPVRAQAVPGSDAVPQRGRDAVAAAVPAAEPPATADAGQIDGVGGPIDAIAQRTRVPRPAAPAADPPLPALRQAAPQDGRLLGAPLAAGGDEAGPRSVHVRNAEAEAALRALIAEQVVPAPPDDLIGSTLADDLDQVVVAVERAPRPSERILPRVERPVAGKAKPARRAPAPTIEEPLAARDEAPLELPRRIRQALQRAEPGVPAAAAGGPLYRVQLAAVDDEAAAQVYWREVNERLPGAFADVDPIFDERLVDQRLYLRIWVGAFDNRVDALGYCGWLKQQGQDCFVTRVDKL
jgi:hypothetical protein